MRSSLVRKDDLLEMSPSLSAFSRSTCFSISALLTAFRVEIDESVRTRFSGIWLLGMFRDGGVFSAESDIVGLDPRKSWHFLCKVVLGFCLFRYGLDDDRMREVRGVMH
jgi:hypothetical protein